MGPVGATAALVGGVEPLGEELAEPGFAARALAGQPVAEAGFQLRFGDGAATVVALDLPQGLGEPGRAEDLPERDVGGAGPLVGGALSNRPYGVGSDGASVQKLPARA